MINTVKITRWQKKLIGGIIVAVAKRIFIEEYEMKILSSIFT